jgi:hypothetical protein
LRGRGQKKSNKIFGLEGAGGLKKYFCVLAAFYGCGKNDSFDLKSKIQVFVWGAGEQKN